MTNRIRAPDRELVHERERDLRELERVAPREPADGGEVARAVDVLVVVPRDRLVEHARRVALLVPAGVVTMVTLRFASLTGSI